ncbi:1,2-phenylacetyl-CoA epoxidase subunit PaaD [Chryseobacterium sp. A301]
MKFESMKMTPQHITTLLEEIPDPEIPVISIVDLGIVRRVSISSDTHVEIEITPTYSACPAMFTIKEDIEALFKCHGILAEVKNVISPAWTTDWISDRGREKLLEYGILPPEKGAELSHLHTSKPCPRCSSRNTEQLSRYGSTLCKATYQCLDCLEPFDYFKCH